MKMYLFMLICCASTNLHSADKFRKIAKTVIQNNRKEKHEIEKQCRYLYNAHMREIEREQELVERIGYLIDTTGSTDARAIKAALPLQHRHISNRIILDEKRGYVANSKGEIYQEKDYEFDARVVAFLKNSASRELPAIRERNDLLEHVAAVGEVQAPTSYKPYKLEKWNPEKLTLDELKTDSYRHFSTNDGIEQHLIEQCWYAYEIDAIVNEKTGVTTATLRIRKVKSLKRDQIVRT